jgi:uncharacterized protein YbgA (DUF1722 family)
LALIAANPLLPVEEEGRLRDPRRRENFIARVFAYHRLRTFFARRWTLAGIAEFHASHKFLLLAHSARAYGRLGRLIENAKGISRAELRARYEAEFMGALRGPAQVRARTKVLEQIVGSCCERLDLSSRSELAGLIAADRLGRVSRRVSIAAPRCRLELHGSAHLERQLARATVESELALQRPR